MDLVHCLVQRLSFAAISFAPRKKNKNFPEWINTNEEGNRYVPSPNYLWTNFPSILALFTHDIFVNSVSVDSKRFPFPPGMEKIHFVQGFYLTLCRWLKFLFDITFWQNRSQPFQSKERKKWREKWTKNCLLPVWVGILFWYVQFTGTFPYFLPWLDLIKNSAEEKKVNVGKEEIKNTIFALMLLASRVEYFPPFSVSCLKKNKAIFDLITVGFVPTATLTH